MTKERINDFKEIVLPSISKFLLDVDYEGQGKCDAAEFAKDFNEILDLAIKALEQEPCDDTVSRGVFEQVMWERDTAIEQLRELGYELGQKIEPCGNVLDKIRAEIEQEIAYKPMEMWDYRMGLTKALDFIDKYKAESEE